MAPDDAAATNPGRPPATVQEVANALRVSARTVRRWIAEGSINAFQLPGRQYRIPQLEVDRLLANSPAA